MLIATVAAVAIAGIGLPPGSAARLALLGPIMFFAALLGDTATAVVLFAKCRYGAADRSMFVLALTFAAVAIEMLIAMLVLRMLPGDPPFVSAPPEAGVSMFISWHLTAGAGAIAYIALRRSQDVNSPTRRFALVTTIVALMAVIGSVTFALALSDRVPILTEMSLFGHLSRDLGRVMGGFLALAALAAFGMRKSTSIDRALALSLLSLALDTFIISLTPRFSTSFYLGRIFLLLAGSFVFVAAVQALLTSRLRLGQVEGTLLAVEGESARRAGRIRAVWRMASQDERSEDGRFSAILEIATAALRPGVPMFGYLSHLDGETLIVDVTCWVGSTPALPKFADAVRPLATFPLKDTLQSLLCVAGRTYAWNDLSVLQHCGIQFAEFGWRRFIGAPVTIGRQTSFVAFASPQTMWDEPFAEDDLAYVDVVASLFASHYTQQQQFERIQFQIEHDALTGLSNRVQFRKAVRDEVRGGSAFTVAFVDLDGFRHVNEQEGNQIGDELLVEVASGLASVTAGDLVARMTADEFGVLLRGAGTRDSAATALKRYADAFLSPFHTGDRDGTQLLNVGASIGAARFPDDGHSAEDLMRRADVALDVAKARGGSMTSIFDGPMEAILEESHLRVVELSDAIARDQLALIYQPTFDLATRAIVGAEALVRWDHPERGRLLPAEFVGFAERNGLIGSLTRWVFGRVVHDLSSTRSLPSGVRVYFNLSAKMLDNVPFIAEVKASLNADPDLANHLGIEVTETAAMQDVERSMHTIELFRRWGLFIAIDDFGTGYSSLSYLTQLTVDMIKIDRSFVAGLPGDERHGAITEMLLRITDRFGFATLAEGIETEAQASWLLEHGCRLGQGYLVSKGLPFAEFRQRLGHGVPYSGSSPVGRVGLSEMPTA